MNDIVRIPLLIDGKAVQSTSTEWIDVLDPATQAVVARVPMATDAELNAAVASAREAFATWRNSGQGTRMRVMLKLQQLIRENTGKLAELITRE
ncbi:MAG: aldehyde dehydrogenase family protein, partial [Burkholderiaceae bacterium]